MNKDIKTWRDIVNKNDAYLNETPDHVSGCICETCTDLATWYDMDR